MTTGDESRPGREYPAMSAQPVEYNLPQPTEEDLADLLHLVATAPDDGYRYEIIDGELVVTPQCKPVHTDIATELSCTVASALPEGWRQYQVLGVVAGGQRVVPDLVILDHRIDRPDEEYHPWPARVVVEIESPSTKRKDRVRKPIAYAQQGFDTYWRIERDCTTHVYTGPQPDGTWEQILVVRPGESLTLTEPFEITLRPADWS